MKCQIQLKDEKKGNPVSFNFILRNFQNEFKSVCFSKSCQTLIDVIHQTKLIRHHLCSLSIKICLPSHGTRGPLNANMFLEQTLQLTKKKVQGTVISSSCIAEMTVLLANLLTLRKSPVIRATQKTIEAATTTPVQHLPFRLSKKSTGEYKLRMSPYFYSESLKGN